MSNPFDTPLILRKRILETVSVKPNFTLNGSGFICALITSRCPVGCSHCMFAANMLEPENSFNTFTEERIDKLITLVKDSNTNYLLISGGGEPFLYPNLMYRLAEKTSANLTWFVTSGFWAKNRNYAFSLLDRMYQSYLKGTAQFPNRKICLRLSLDFQHLEKINSNKFEYIINIIDFFEEKIGNNSNFFFQIHSIEGNELLIDQLIKTLNGKLRNKDSVLHSFDKKTESHITATTSNGFIFDITFAKLLLSNLAPDLSNLNNIKESINIWEKDHNINEKGHAPLQINSDGTIGSDMLVIYDGRVSGAWQSEMPDVKINIDTHCHKSIMKSTFSDIAVLATIEKGLDYRFNIINEVSEKSCIRAKAVNIRDYTSPILMEEDTIKLYYTIRAAQDYITNNRLNYSDSELKSIFSLKKNELIQLFHSSNQDILKQFYNSDSFYKEIIEIIEQYFKKDDITPLIKYLDKNKNFESIKIDKFRLLIERIGKSWYEIKKWSNEDLNKLIHIEEVLKKSLNKKIGIYEGLSRL
ncbi:4Fe-4S cluster-binding domain-containing protein [Acinetobacter albensis]|nr:4Fe-4S cluster-binding domain-containing protein [Acinetobacter albensis]